MFTLPRGREAGVSVLGDLAPDTLAGELAVGHDGGSGMVPAAGPIHTDPDSGGRTDELVWRRPVITNPQPVSDLLPIPGVETRPMYGGVRVAHHTGLLHDGAPFDGSHVELVNRVSVVILDATEQMEPTPGDTLPSLRVPPPSDPYGRMCINAKASAR